jgi:flagellin
LTAANLQADLNGIAGLSGFSVVDASGMSSGNTTDLRITATESFGDFDIYTGTDVSVSANRNTSSGVGGHASFTTANAIRDYTLTNNADGTSYTFQVAASASAAAEATAFQAGIRAATGDDGWTAYAGVSSATTVHVQGPGDFGSWTLAGSASGTAFTVTSVNAGDKNIFDIALAAGGGSNADSATVQGSIQLTGSKLFSVSQGNEAAATTSQPKAVVDPAEATGSTLNDNYFTTQGAQLKTVSNVDFRTADGAGSAIKVIDGAIERVSSMRSNLGAIENRLNHTVSNLMNVAENTSAARSRIQDADFSVESANLAKSQVLQQAGTAMLAQANAKSQLVLQLLQ